MINGRVIAIPDAHIPYHHARAWGAALNLVSDQTAKSTSTVQLGDFPDNEAFSRHGKTFGRKLDPDAHLKKVQIEARELENAARGKVTWLLGNHCAWVHKYVAAHAPSAEVAMKPIGELLGYSSEPIPYQKMLRIGKVNYVHDQGFAGANATRQTLAAVGGCIVHGHDHRATCVYSGDTNGDRWFGMGCGWLGDADKITYAPPSRTCQWQLAIGVIDYREGLAFARVVPFVKGRFVLDGKVYRP